MTMKSACSRRSTISRRLRNPPWYPKKLKRQWNLRKCLKDTDLAQIISWLICPHQFSSHIRTTSVISIALSSLARVCATTLTSFMSHPKTVVVKLAKPSSQRLESGFRPLYQIWLTIDTLLIEVTKQTKFTTILHTSSNSRKSSKSHRLRLALQSLT